MSTASVPGSSLHETANERFKRQSGAWTWEALIVAVCIHFAAFAFWPAFTAADIPLDGSEPPEILNLPPEIELPEPPAPIRMPAVPVIAADAPDDITIPSTRIEQNPVDLLPPPPTTTAEDLSGFEALAPNMVPPRLRNAEEVRRTLERNYPSVLRDTGIGGTVNVHIWLDENGEIVQSRIGRSSGYAALDEAALRVVEIMRFAPALNRDRAVRVIVNLPIQFETR